MKKLRKILNTIVWVLLGAYILLSVLLHLPAVQRYTGSLVAKTLQEKFGTRVEVGNINLGFLNRIIIDDFQMADKAGKEMLRAARLSVNISLSSLTEGKMVISSVQIFGLRANLYKQSAQSQPNYQFVIDSLSTGEKKESQIDLKINSFIIRHGSLTYNQLDVVPSPGKFNTRHISISDVSSHIIIKHITNKEINAVVKKLSFNEQSGLELRKVSFAIFANEEQSYIKDLNIHLGESVIQSDSIGASNYLSDGKLHLEDINASGSLRAGALYPSAFAFLMPPLKRVKKSMRMLTEFNCTQGRITITKFNLNTSSGDLLLAASGNVSPFRKPAGWSLALSEFRLSESAITTISQALSAARISLPKKLASITSLSIKGKAAGAGDMMNAKAEISSNIGKADIEAERNGEGFIATLRGEEIKLGTLFPESKLGDLTLQMNATGRLRGNSIEDLSLKGNVESLGYNNYTFNDLNIDGIYSGHDIKGNLSLKDENCDFSIAGAVSGLSSEPSVQLTANVNHLAPQRINLSRRWGDATFSGIISANTRGKTVDNLRGDIRIDNFLMDTHDQTYAIDSIHASVGSDRLSILSSVGTLSLNGSYRLSTIPESVIGMLAKKFPMLGKAASPHRQAGNRFSLSANITDTRWLPMLLRVPFASSSPISIGANVDDRSNSIDAEILMPSFTYAESAYSSGHLSLCSLGDTIEAKAGLRKLLKGDHDATVEIKAVATDNEISSMLTFDSNSATRIRGTLNSTTHFITAADGTKSVRLSIAPSEVMVKDTVWNIAASDILYNSHRIEVDHFAIEHNQQHVRIDGTATRSSDDSICVDLQNVDVEYILDLVNFHSVDFSGQATGKAYLKSVLDSPDMWANLRVDGFRFEGGRMGTLYADASWNKREKQIDIDAHADDGADSQTIIRGYVSPSKNYIDLGIDARHTNIEFIESFCGSFMDDVNASATGHVQVVGDLKEINLVGELVAEGNLRITTLNTVYNLRGDTIRMIPDEIIFSCDTVYDRNGNTATVNGALHHKHLTRMTYDIDVEADHLLCYDTHGYGDQTFYGTVYASGKCQITGRPRNINFNITATPHRDSFIEYNAAGPDAINDSEFISWISHDTDSLANTPSDALALHERASIASDLNDASDIHINFTFNTTPDFTLRLLMDETTGDKISLNGSGDINATWFNKGAFEMFGTYLIDSGSYNLTIQNIIRKDFHFEQGSSIIFGGNPYSARLNLKAVYPVNGVSLADLHLGNSFSSNNVRVNCIMNIGGTPENIGVDFDFDMPTVNNDAKQMVRSLINSEEEMNQQVVYLLAIGRFYMDNGNNSTQEDAQQSQTSLAMQSLLSGTISQQVNNILGSLIKNNNWNFGTNISTGTEGFNNAEYEGILSGSMFNNRLLINGQFGYRDNANTTSSFIGDFDIKYLLTPNGNWAIKVYNQTNDRYFTKSSLNTQGLGLIIKKDFGSWLELFGRRKKKEK